eukprot:gene16148-19156_t
MSELHIAGSALLSSSAVHEACKHLAKGPECTLQELNLRGKDVNAQDIAALASHLSENTSVTTIDLAGNNIGPEGVSTLAAALKQNRSVTSLNLSSTQMFDQGTPSFGSIPTGTLVLNFKLNPLLTLLKVLTVATSVPYAAAVALAEMLLHNKSLTSLGLGNNYLRDVGAKSMGAMLAKNASLIQLNVRDNSISPAGATSLSNGLKRNTTLKT